VSASSATLFVLLFSGAYFVGPVGLVWGWARWSTRPRSWSVSATLSFLGFMTATASAFLAISSVAYAQVHFFRFYDPLLMRIFRAGFLLSTAALASSIGGVWRSSVLRWFSVASAAGTFAFWLCAAAGE
jgi:hypothetical protein